MRIIQKSADVSEEVLKAFARFKGWKDQIMTETESPNYLIDNPETFTDFIKKTYGSPIQNDLAKFNMQEAEEQAKIKQEEAEEIINNAKIEAQAIADQMFEITIE